MTHPERIQAIRQAIEKMKEARALLRSADANRAADYVARALRSAQGAERHADNLTNRRN